MTVPPLHPTAGELVSVEASVTGRAAVLTAVGEIDSTSASLVGDTLDALLDGAGVAEVTVDLTAVTFLDAAGLCVLAAAHSLAVRRNVSLRLLASAHAVVRPLQITGLWNLLEAEHVEAGGSGRQSVGAA